MSKIEEIRYSQSYAEGNENNDVEVDEEKELPVVALKGHDREKKKRSMDVLVEGKHENVEFSDMQLPEDILKGLQLCRYDKPTPIQLSAIPLGKLNYDLLLQAKSGTGKTCVFTVCVLQEVVVSERCIQALVLSPCREIAVQISYVMKSIGAFKDGLKIKEFIGGTSVPQSVRRTTKCHIAVGTPGRLAHMVKEFKMDLSQVKVIALDEADKLMEPSFFKDVEIIFNALPTEKQIIATSATYSENVLNFLEKLMRSPCRIQLDLDNPALCAVDQYMVDVKKVTGSKVSNSQTDEVFKVKFRCLKEILQRVPYTQVIVFSNYQLRAEKLYDELKGLDFDVQLLSAARSQEDRLNAFTSLQQGKCRILVATDVASRGIDVEGLDLVINFDIPMDSDTYIHRIGRTGRFGSFGKALSMCYFETERKSMSEFQIEIKFTMWVVETLEEINGIDDHAQKVQKTYRQLKGIKEPITLQDPENHNLKEFYNYCTNLKLENDTIEQYTWCGFKIGLNTTQLVSAKNNQKANFETAKQAREVKMNEAGLLQDGNEKESKIDNDVSFSTSESESNDEDDEDETETESGSESESE